MSARVAVIVALCAGASGCAHSILVKSEPPGATVLVEGKNVGKTPCTVEETTGGSGLVVVEVQQGPRAQRFAYDRSGFATTPIVGGVAVGAAVFVAGVTLFVGSALAFPFVVVGTVATVGLLAPLLLGVGALYILGTVGVATGPQIPIWSIGMYGRQGPDAIDVDFTQSPTRVSSSPPEMVVPFLGHTAAVPPAPAPAPGPQ